MVEHATGSDRLFITWNTYSTDGAPEWRVLVCDPPLYGYRGCKIHAPSRQGLVMTGVATLASRSFWTASDRMVLDLRVGETQRSIPLFRFAID